MAKIIIGREYASEFESICALYGGGFLSPEVHILKAKGKIIETPAHTFEYSEREHGVNGSGDGEERALSFTSEGASWFAPLRGENFDSGNADWKQLIMDVAADYHRHYSLIEFKQAKDKGTLNGERKLKEKFKTGFIDRVFADGAKYFVAENRITEPENYYAVSLRLEINGGGESAPLLGKIYFREGEDGRLSPITFKEAGRIDEYISSSVPDEDGRGGEGIVDVKLVGRVFAGLEKSFASGKFSKYVSFNAKYKREIDGMLSQLATSEIKELECTNVKVLGVSHVEWEKSVYPVTYRGKVVLKFIVGLNGYVSLICANCNNAVLVDGNVIKFKDDKVPENCNSVINFDADNLGLIEDDIEAIKTYGEAGDHLFTVSCEENQRNGDCRRTVCASQTVTFADGVRKCKSCRYPEVVFKDIFAEEGQDGKYTPALHFAFDKLCLVDTPTVKCRCCGREYAKSGIVRGELCAFCADIDRSAGAKKLYRKYGGMLSLTVRLSHLFSKKYCMEDANVVLFELGTDRYVFDKLSAARSGFIKKPRKVKRGDV
ncbi:MAG: hypothetical protein K2N30_03820 [Clostridia bacterium]|nr:hypothetical protein [Clostridia bacterium]